jgi:hypothetical protein
MGFELASLDEFKFEDANFAGINGMGDPYSIILTYEDFYTIVSLEDMGKYLPRLAKTAKERLEKSVRIGMACCQGCYLIEDLIKKNIVPKSIFDFPSVNYNPDILFAASLLSNSETRNSWLDKLKDRSVQDYYRKLESLSQKLKE